VILYRFGSDALRPADEEFNAQGGVLAPGRWSLVGRPCVYASTCEPLALLEKLIHFAGLRRPACSLYIADVPDNLIEDLPAASLPPDWRSIYPPASTQQLGSNWLASKSAAGLLSGAAQGTLRYDPISRLRPPDNFRFQYCPCNFLIKLIAKPLS
jgi:RES domain-containing protein